MLVCSRSRVHPSCNDNSFLENCFTSFPSRPCSWKENISNMMREENKSVSPNDGFVTFEISGDRPQSSRSCSPRIKKRKVNLWASMIRINYGLITYQKFKKNKYLFQTSNVVFQNKYNHDLLYKYPISIFQALSVKQIIELFDKEILFSVIQSTSWANPFFYFFHVLENFCPQKERTNVGERKCTNRTRKQGHRKKMYNA